MYKLKERELPLSTFDIDNFDINICPTDPMLSVLFNVLSLSLCDFERNICRIAKDLMPKVSNVELATLLSEFIRQEAGHTKVHMKYNAAILRSMQHIKTKEIITTDAYLRKELGIDSSDFNKNLQFYILIELHTANFARYFLQLLQTKLDKMYPLTTYLFGFHFVEECEHRSVLFDAYQDVYQQAPNHSLENIATWHKLEKILIDRLIVVMAYVMSADALYNGEKVSGRKLQREIRDFLCAADGCFPGGYICPEYANRDFNPYYSNLNYNEWITQWDNVYGPALLNKINS
jgi:predicted metal-dependent hydrolase